MTFALILCLALVLYQYRAWTGMAAAVGWLPLARYEGLPVVALFLLVLLRNRRYRDLGLVVLPMAVQNTVAAARAHDPPYVLFPLDRLFRSASQTLFDYGSGSAFYYGALIPVAYGGIIAVLAAYGFMRSRLSLLHACPIVVVAVLSVSYWLLPATGIAGYSRHLAVASPVVGVLAAIGVDRLGRPGGTDAIDQHFTSERLTKPTIGGAVGTSTLREGSRWRLGWPHSIRMIATLILLVGIGIWLLSRQMQIAASAAFVVAGITCWPRFNRRVVDMIVGLLILLATGSALLTVQPYTLQPEQQTAIDVGQWLASGGVHDQLVLGSHAWIVYASGIDRFDRHVFQELTVPNVDAAPIGSVIIWDAHYSHRLGWQTPLVMLQDTHRFRLMRTFTAPTGFVVYVFQKIAD